MRPLAHGARLALGLTLAATALPAQSTTAPSLRTRDDSLGAIAAMRASLRMLVTAEEGHWADRGTYTTDMASLGFAQRRANDLAHPQVIFAGSRGWTAMSSHRALRGLTCVMYVGNADELPKLPVTERDRRAAE